LIPPSLGKLHPVGRLDLNTEGLLILTNDGDFTNYITSAKNRVPKIYEAKVKGIPPPFAIHKLQRGITLEDGFKTAPAEIEFIKQTKTNAWFRVTLYEGHNLQIRKMFDSINHSVVKLKRVAIGSIRDERLRVGEYRFLAPHEIKRFMRRERKPAIKPVKKR
jgi:23S rRNA pseudouridine2605 synthase